MQKSRVKTSDMALKIIETIAFSEETISQTQLAEAVGIVKSAAHKHLYTLEESGWIIRDQMNGRYSLGPKAWLVGQRATLINDLAKAAEAEMRAARNDTGLAVVLSSVNKTSLNVIAAYHGTHDIEIGVRQGSRLELHASAQGQVMLAFSPSSLTEKTCSTDLPALTPKTITDPHVLRVRIEDTRKKGYAVAPEETLLGVNVIAAPIFDHTNQLIATIALVGSIQHLTQTPDEGHVQTIRTLANSISQTRGHGIER